MSGKITSAFNKRSWNSMCNVNCTIKNIVYAMQCNQCGKLYVGQTKNQIKIRFQQHFYSIASKGEGIVPNHFNLPDHKGWSDVKITVLSFIHDPLESKNGTSPYRSSLATWHAHPCPTWPEYSWCPEGSTTGPPCASHIISYPVSMVPMVLLSCSYWYPQVPVVYNFICTKWTFLH